MGWHKIAGQNPETGVWYSCIPNDRGMELGGALNAIYYALGASGIKAPDQVAVSADELAPTLLSQDQANPNVTE